MIFSNRPKTGVTIGSVRYGTVVNSDMKHKFSGTTPINTVKVICPKDNQEHEVEDEGGVRFWCSGCKSEISYAETLPRGHQ